jgi:hypothetical protein
MIDWQPIETAPKVINTWVLLKGGTNEWAWDVNGMPEVVLGHWPKDRWQVVMLDGRYCTGMYHNPTHWAPNQPVGEA